MCRSTFGTLGKIAQKEGVYALWRGTEASLLITVPLIALYLPLYDTLLQSLQGAGAGAIYSPLLAGSGARAFACMVVAPLELLKTRLQGRPQVIPPFLTLRSAPCDYATTTKVLQCSAVHGPGQVLPRGLVKLLQRYGTWAKAEASVATIVRLGERMKQK